MDHNKIRNPLRCTCYRKRSEKLLKIRLNRSMLGRLSSLPVAGDGSTATTLAIESLLRLIRDVARISATGFKGRFKRECTDLSRRVSLLLHLFEEIRDSQLHMASSSSSFRSSTSQLMAALKAAIMLLQSAGSFDHNTFPRRATVTSQFQGVASKLENALSNFPYGEFELSEDVKEQVDLVRAQLKRAAQGDVIKSKAPLKPRNAEELYDLIPVDFLCPISLELIKDPVTVSTGQTYERSYIERWIKDGNRRCPKSCQELKNLNLIPNYVLRNLVAQWCTDNNVKQAALSGNTIPEKIEDIVDNPSTLFFEEQMVPHFIRPSVSCFQAGEESGKSSNYYQNFRRSFAEASRVSQLLNICRKS